ncbi:rhomboid family intramembrane serine protease [Companilactobacillus halodurans]|uniref:Rhomboid family intramembrane serine protease n=1 Tax=Companilactobacillus halodurans TaxID=2584183 RepID=A0A5P0ZQP3_9LACO|nr:rhomboid family intramembrane serine protease [Companilactobacillus halodurans]MQS76512.1 rhomboid family intramembrane serine protease [Companilactobacillus halodurans]MQS97039.1 rhomboid family intramembrane serine protease [Companilactobacillus halodurans]
MQIFSRQNKAYVTWTLLAITIVVFLIETFIGGSQKYSTLILMGAKTNWLVQAGQWWRLFTPIFLHIGFFHILMNGFTLLYVGQVLEPIIGHWRFLAIYLVSGVTGNLASFAFGANNAISAGASTSLFGMFAVFLALAAIYRENRFIIELGKSFLALIVINLLMDLTMSGIDIWGHVGGALGGLLLGYGLSVPKSRRPKMIYRIISIIAVFAIAYFMYAKGMIVYG